VILVAVPLWLTPRIVIARPGPAGCEPICVWQLVEVIDAEAPGAVIGTTHVAGVNKLPIIIHDDGTFSADGRFLWKEWITDLQCLPSTIVLEDVTLAGRLEAGVFNMTVNKHEVGQQTRRRCPGAKGLQLIDLPDGDIALQFQAEHGATFEMPIESPMAGVHRFVLQDPSLLSVELLPPLQLNEEADLGGGLFITVAGVRNGESGQFFVVSFSVRNDTMYPARLAWDTAKVHARDDLDRQYPLRELVNYSAVVDPDFTASARFNGHLDASIGYLDVTVDGPAGIDNRVWRIRAEELPR